MSGDSADLCSRLWAEELRQARTSAQIRAHSRR